VDLERFSKHLKLPVHLKPKFFPVAGDDAARLIIAADMHHGSAQAAKLAGAVLSAVWTQERNIADTQTLTELLSENQLDAACLEVSRSSEVQKRYDANTQEAIDVGVFGSPAYVIDGELFWGQDRLDFVSRKLLGK
jgi:2-hydroxychromene-2-carboxylate isomerase